MGSLFRQEETLFQNSIFIGDRGAPTEWRPYNSNFIGDWGAQGMASHVNVVDNDLRRRLLFKRYSRFNSSALENNASSGSNERYISNNW